MSHNSYAHRKKARYGSNWSACVLEPRVMLAGDAGAVVAQAVDCGTSADCLQQVNHDCQQAVVADRIVFVDEAIEDLAVLADAVVDEAEIVLIKRNCDPITQITAVLQDRQQINQVSLVTHGADGLLKFSDSFVDTETLNQRASEIRSWRAALAPGADILLFGCNVAATDAGRALVGRLSALTGADVAASIDRTGNLDDHADWELEYTIGSVGKSELFCAATIRGYTHTLDVVMHAWGQTGDERISLLIDDEVVATYDLNQTHQALRYETSESVSANQVKIRFFNDLYLPAIAYDRNVTVESIQIDGEFFETEDVTVRSTGTWRSEDGVRVGFGRGELMHANGEFQFGTNLSNDTGSQLQIAASGQTGNERFALSIGNQLIGDFDVATYSQTFFFQTQTPINADAVRIQFLNDSYVPGGLDNNLIVDKIVIDGQVFQTEAPDVYSTGTWKPADNVTPGFRQSEVLHTNGYFQYGADVQGQTELLVDTSFGNSGVIRYGESSRGFYESPDGGFFRSAGNQILKYAADFQVDQGFGTAGAATIPVDGSLGIQDLAVLSDSTVIALSRDATTLDNHQLHRISSTGQYLNSVTIDDLGAGAVTRFGSGPQIETLNDDTIVLGAGKDSTSVIALFGLNADLSLNRAFGDNGIIEHNGLMRRFDSLSDIVATSDGGFLAYTPLDTLTGVPGRSLYKFTSNGQFDTSYGNDGISESVAATNFAEFISDVQLDSQGRAVARNNAGFVRWTPDGFLDSSFGVGGVAELELAPVEIGGQTTTLRSGPFGIDPQDRLVVNRAALRSNVSQPPTELGVLFGRLNEDGSTDITLGTQVVSVDTAQAVAGELIVDDQGRIVVVGGLLGSSFSIDPAVARYFFA